MKPGAYKKQFGIPGKQLFCKQLFRGVRRAMANERGLADNFAKAREVRMANIESRKAVPAKAVKAKASAKVKAPQSTDCSKSTGESKSSSKA
jgi:hypothetical protein